MTTMTTCPRGHNLEPNAVYCTVCWMRVEPEDPEVAASRMRRRRRVWLPLFGAGAVLVGVGIGGVLAVSSPPAVPAIVAEPAAPVEAAPVEAAPAEGEAVEAAPAVVAAPEEPVEVTSEPLAATVDEAPPSTLACAAEVKTGSAACSLDGAVASVVVCVPAETATMTLRARAAEDDPWAETTDALVPADAPDCTEGRIGAALVVDTSDPSTSWKVVSRDADGDRLWRSPLGITAVAS